MFRASNAIEKVNGITDMDLLRDKLKPLEKRLMVFTHMNDITWPVLCNLEMLDTILELPLTTNFSNVDFADEATEAFSKYDESVAINFKDFPLDKIKLIHGTFSKKYNIPAIHNTLRDIIHNLPAYPRVVDIARILTNRFHKESLRILTYVIYRYDDIENNLKAILLRATREANKITSASGTIIPDRPIISPNFNFAESKIPYGTIFRHKFFRSLWPTNIHIISMPMVSYKLAVPIGPTVCNNRFRYNDRDQGRLEHYLSDNYKCRCKDFRNIVDDIHFHGTEHIVSPILKILLHFFSPDYKKSTELLDKGYKYRAASNTPDTNLENIFSKLADKYARSYKTTNAAFYPICEKWANAAALCRELIKKKELINPHPPPPPP